MHGNAPPAAAGCAHHSAAGILLALAGARLWMDVAPAEISPRQTGPMDDSLPPTSSNDQARPGRLIKGRGAASNPEGRFESIRHQAEDDGWQSALLDEDGPRPRTEVTEERARSVISRNDIAGYRFQPGNQSVSRLRARYDVLVGVQLISSRKLPKNGVLVGSEREHLHP